MQERNPKFKKGTLNARKKLLIKERNPKMQERNPEWCKKGTLNARNEPECKNGTLNARKEP